MIFHVIVFLVSFIIRQLVQHFQVTKVCVFYHYLEDSPIHVCQNQVLKGFVKYHIGDETWKNLFSTKEDLSSFPACLTKETSYLKLRSIPEICVLN